MVKNIKDSILAIILLLFVIFVIIMCVKSINVPDVKKETIEDKIGKTVVKVVEPVGKIEETVKKLEKEYCTHQFIDPIQVVKDYDPTKEWYEYNPETHVAVFEGATTDENGIALASGKYNPVTISQYGLNAFGRYITEDNKKYLDIAIKQAEYLLNMQDKKTGAFYYDYDWKVYASTETLKAPWTSAMAVGNVLSLFSRVYNETHDKRYLDAGVKALGVLTKSVKDGGVVSTFNGHKFYEEYPTTRGNYALNGFMFTIIGLYDFSTVTGNKQAYKLYKDGIDTLRYILPYYDSYGISLYHLSHLFYEKQPIHYSSKYHMIHIGQLELLDQIENDDIFKYYINRWKNYTC